MVGCTTGLVVHKADPRLHVHIISYILTPITAQHTSSAFILPHSRPPTSWHCTSSIAHNDATHSHRALYHGSVHVCLLHNFGSVHLTLRILHILHLLPDRR
jgi:hypothetical protein